MYAITSFDTSKIHEMAEASLPQARQPVSVSCVERDEEKRKTYLLTDFCGQSV